MQAGCRGQTCKEERQADEKRTVMEGGQAVKEKRQSEERRTVRRKGHAVRRRVADRHTYKKVRVANFKLY
jgi:hypothetical protein